MSGDPLEKAERKGARSDPRDEEEKELAKELEKGWAER